MKIIIYILFLVSLSNLYSQREYYNWYFGYNTGNSNAKAFGLIFNDTTNSPKVAFYNKRFNAIHTNPISMSDKLGNLLFTTDNDTLRDENFNFIFAMRNEFFSNETWIEIDASPFCITDINNKNIHYLFYNNGMYTANAIPTWINIDNLKFAYWVYNSQTKKMIEIDKIFCN